MKNYYNRLFRNEFKAKNNTPALTVQQSVWMSTSFMHQMLWHWNIRINASLCKWNYMVEHSSKKNWSSTPVRLLPYFKSMHISFQCDKVLIIRWVCPCPFYSSLYSLIVHLVFSSVHFFCEFLNDVHISMRHETTPHLHKAFDRIVFGEKKNTYE